MSTVKSNKKALSTSEVKELREANLPKVFNMVAALEAVENTTPRVSKSGALGDFSADLIALFKEAGKPLAINQIVAAFKAGGKEVTSKQVADRCWLLAKRGTLKKGDAKGLYEIA